MTRPHLLDGTVQFAVRARAEPARLATALLAAIEGGMALSQARKDMASLRVAVEAGLAQVRAWAS